MAPPPVGPPRIVIEAINAGSLPFMAAQLAGCAVRVSRIEYVLTDKALEIWIGPWRVSVLKFAPSVGAWIPEEIRPNEWHSWTGVQHPGLWITRVKPGGIGQCRSTRRESNSVPSWPRRG